MRDVDGKRLAATDLSNHVACGHLTSLSVGDARRSHSNYSSSRRREMVLGVLRCGFFLAAAAALSGCSTYKEVSGSSLLLDVTPRPPSFAGAYDFDLLEQVGGKACITRGNNSSTYWLGMTELAKLSSDSLTREAIAAAAFDAISRLDEADTLVLTRVVAEGNGVHRVCATVYGRGVRLKKAAPLLPTAERNTTKPVASPGDDEPTDKHDEE